MQDMNKAMVQRLLNTNNQINLTGRFQVRPLLSGEAKKKGQSTAQLRPARLSRNAMRSCFSDTVCIIAFVTCWENKVTASWIKYGNYKCATKDKAVCTNSYELQKDSVTPTHNNSLREHAPSMNKQGWGATKDKEWGIMTCCSSHELLTANQTNRNDIMDLRRARRWGKLMTPLVMRPRWEEGSAIGSEPPSLTSDWVCSSLNNYSTHFKHISFLRQLLLTIRGL